VAAGILLLAASSVLTAQQAPRLVTKFANPAYDNVSRTYSIDVMVTSLGAEETFFGMNLRFFYDATMLEYRGIDQYAQGIGFIREEPKSVVGNDISGVQLLGLDRAAGYVNGGLEGKDERYPLVIRPGAWSKLCRAHFYVPMAFQDEVEFCPSLVWDKKPDLDAGGLLGSEGVLIAVKEDDRSTRADSRMSVVEGEPFNWQYRKLAGLPYGEPASKECITLAQTTSTEDPAQTEAEGYVLFQNQPNPFDEQTTIEFILPYAQQAKLILYTTAGERLEVIDGYYPAGRSKVLLQRKPWMARTGLVYYQLVAGDNVTLVRKMNLVNR
jgi:hypothetical protein